MSLITRTARKEKLTISEMDGNLTYLEELALGGLSGSDYVYVSANGTPTENAEELRAAYELAKIKVDNKTTFIPHIPGYFTYASGYLQLSYDSMVKYGGEPIQNNVIYEMLFDRVSYFASYDGMRWVFINNVYPPGEGYTTLEILVSTTTYNLVTIVVSPGKYFFDTVFAIDSEHISIVSLTGNTDVIIMSNLGWNQPPISIEVDNILVKGIDCSNHFLRIGNNLPFLTVEKCYGGNYSFSTSTFSPGDVISGTFIDCKGAAATFGAGTNSCTGTFINCEAYNGFCTAQTVGVASGIFTNCIGGGYSFGASSSASGTFTNCIGGGSSFGGSSDGKLTGKLFYCRLTSGNFKTVSSGGRTYYCVDGNGNTNNQ